MVAGPPFSLAGTWWGRRQTYTAVPDIMAKGDSCGARCNLSGNQPAFRGGSSASKQEILERLVRKAELCVELEQASAAAILAGIAIEELSSWAR